jgi:hypothetical protein
LLGGEGEGQAEGEEQFDAHRWNEFYRR